MRREVLERAGYRCARCQKAGRMEVDHVVSLQRGGKALDSANLQALCVSCHIAKTRSETRPPRTPAEDAWSALVDALR